MPSLNAVESPRILLSCWGRRCFIVGAVTWTIVVVLIVIGALLPKLPVLGTLGTLSESWISLHIVIAGLIGLLLALATTRLGSKRGGAAITALALLGTAGATVPMIALLRAAHRYGVSISWLDHLRVEPSESGRSPSQTLAYATIDGKTLFADIYLPARPVIGRSTPVLMMHGGGYVRGTRSMGRNWDAWLAGRGYTVFDVDYRLAPPPTWNLAAGDAACAIVWVRAHADAYHIATNRMMVAGQSAGAGLALQLAFGLGDGTVQSSCGGSVPEPTAVFVLYPPDDVALGWNMNTNLGPYSARAFLSAYIGGSPQQYPERYREVSATFHVRAGLPPTLIASGEHDHLVPYRGHVELLQELVQVGVPSELVTIPYGDHSFDLAWGSIGAQITRHALVEFLNQYLPATDPR